MTKKFIIEMNCLGARCALFSYFVFVLDFYFAMGKYQAGKSDNYPSHRKPYSSRIEGIGGWKKKNDSTANSNTPRYFDMWLQKQREKGRLKSSSLY